MKRVLIADPDGGIRVSMGMLLREHYHVLMASKGSEVIEGVKNEGIDILILDAGVNGSCIFDLLKIVRETAPDLPIIIMYIYLDESQHVLEYIRNVADACVVKPFKNDNLIEIMELLLHDRKDCCGSLKRRCIGC